jgi:hypothetical protein
MSEKDKVPKLPEPKARNYSEKPRTEKLNEHRLPTSSLNPPEPKPKPSDGGKK